MATVSIVIEGDSSGASAAIDEIGQRAAALPPVFNQVDTASTGAFEHSRESARLLREETGIFLPRALQGLIAQSAILGPALNLAFSGLAVVGFGEIVVSVGKKVFDLAGEISGAKERMKEMEEATLTLGQAEGKLAEATKTYIEQLRYAGLEGSKLNEAEVLDAHMQVANMQAKVAGLQALRVAVEQTSHEMVETWKGDAETGAGIWVKGLSQAAQDAQVHLKSIDREIAVWQEGVARSNTELLKAEDALKKVYGEETRQDIRATTEELRKEDELMNRSIQALDEYYKQLGEQATKESEHENKLMNDSIAASGEYYKQLGEESKKYAEAWTRARDTMANQLDSFFNELTSGNIGQAFLKQFEKLVSQMVATWLMGVQGIRGSITRSGGIFGDLLGFGGGGGPLFGGVPAGGALSGLPGVDLSGISSGSGVFSGPEASMLGLGLSAGGGGGSAPLSSLPAGASSVGGAASSALSFGGLLKGLGSLLPIGALAGGSALLGHSGILGAAGSGLLGYGAGAVAGPLLTSAAESLFLSGSIGGGLATTLGTIGSFLGPIGAGIGLIAGLIGLFTGGGKVKVQQTQVLQQMERDLTNLQNAFSVHAVDYNSAIAQAEQIRSSYTQQQEQIQQGGGPSRVDPWVNATETYINNIEAQRQNSLAAAANFGPAQFESGGYVHPSMARMVPGFRAAMHFAMGGAVPAIVHAGEYVLSAAAVNRVGLGTLNNINNGGGGGDIHIYANDAKSFEEMLNSNDHRRAVIRSLRRWTSEGYL
jgi:hypothetical protein